LILDHLAGLAALTRSAAGLRATVEGRLRALIRA
jgi:hypothetical protein